MSRIHPSAIIEDGAELHPSVIVGAFSLIHAGTRLDEGCTVGSHCELGLPTPLAAGMPLVSGAGAVIRSHSVFYAGSLIGSGLTTGHGVRVREHTRAGDRVQIGTGSELQGDCEVGDDVRMQSNVFVPKHTRIGNFVWLLPGVTLTNDPTPPSDDMLGVTVGDFATLAANVTVLPGVHIGHHAVVAAASCVTRHVAPGTLVMGAPARLVGPASAVCLRRDGTAAYPWTRHFQRGYRMEDIAAWQHEQAHGELKP